MASVENNRVYSYEFDEESHSLQEPVVYDFDEAGIHLTKITRAATANWTTNDSLTLQDAEQLSLNGLEVTRQNLASTQLSGVEPVQVFRPSVDKPSQLSSSGLKTYLKAAQRRGMQVSALALALQRKYTTPLGAVVMAFIGIPLALSFGRKGAVIALCVAVGVSVAYLGVTGGFQQLGSYGLLPPAVAAWSPTVIFAAAGTYFLSRLRT
jgi:lipopolysaccharide export LptBFGC system permease protein LptF